MGAVVLKFTSGQWATVGTPTSLFSGLAAASWAVQLVLEPSGIPLVALYGASSAPLADQVYSVGGGGQDYIPQAQPITIRKFDGSAWTTLGAPASGIYPSLALDADGVPHLALGDASVVGLRATVLRFTGTAWEPVGGRGFSAGAAYWNHLAFDPAGRLHCALLDRGAHSSPESESAGYFGSSGNGALTVKQFEGGSWVNVGNNRRVRTYDYGSIFPALAFSPGPISTPYAAISQQYNFGLLDVYHYPGPPPPPPVSADGVAAMNLLLLACTLFILAGAQSRRPAPSITAT